MGRQRLQTRLILALAFCAMTQLPKALAQNPNESYESAQDAPGCPRQAGGFPPLPMSVVTSCQKGDSVEVTMPLNPDANGQPQEKRVRGAYEFLEFRIPESDTEYAFDNLKRLISMAGFILKYSSKPSTITVRKGNTWMLINVNGEFYNVSVVTLPEEPWNRVKTADEIAQEMKAHGRVSIYGIQFSPGDQAIQEEQSDILFEILKYLKANPGLSVVIESHKFSTVGYPEDDSEITRERANAVMDWLIAHGVARSRVQPLPCGRDNPIADNESPQGVQRNESIVLAKSRS